MTEERSEEFAVLYDEDDSIPDAESQLRDALTSLQDYRRREDKNHACLLDAQVAVESAYCTIRDEIDETSEPL